MFLRWASVFCLYLPLLGCSQANVSDLLESYLWQNRIIITFAPSERDASFQEQRALLKRHYREVVDRDVILWHIFADGHVMMDNKRKAHLPARTFYKHFQVPAEGLTVILIGKDGTEKLRRQSVVAPLQMMAAIDKLPMREQEMQKNNQGGKATMSDKGNKQQETATAIFAGGCFWCMEAAFDQLEGVERTTSGFAGGTVENPTYEQVSGGGSGHVEALKVDYDPRKVSYAELLEMFWFNIDPVDEGGQFADRGFQYTTAIFYSSEQQRQQAEASKQELEKRLQKKVVTRIVSAQQFYPAEEYHQDYHQKNPIRYQLYHQLSGRSGRLKQLKKDLETKE